jgi:hypothetical protein
LNLEKTGFLSKKTGCIIHHGEIKKAAPIPLKPKSGSGKEANLSRHSGDRSPGNRNAPHPTLKEELH